MRSEWPENMRWVLDLFLKSPDAEGLKSTYSPRFIVASKQQNKMILCSAGEQGWSATVKPWLDKTYGA